MELKTAEIGRAPADLRNKCLDLAINSCRILWTMVNPTNPLEVAAYWGSRPHQDSQAPDDLDLLISGPELLEIDPRFLFALGPYFLPLERLFRLSALNNTLPIVAEIIRDHSEDELKQLSDWLDEAALSIPAGGGQHTKLPTSGDMIDWCHALYTVVPTVMANYPSLGEFFLEKQKVRDKYILDRSRDPGFSIRKVGVWDLVGPKWIPPRRVVRPGSQSDPWSEIRRFIGLPDSTEIKGGWIAAGFKLNHGHEAQGQVVSRRPGVITGTMQDVVSTHGVGYIVRGGAAFRARAHHANVQPSGDIVLAVTPESFREFASNWWEDLANVPPTLEMYRKFGLHRDRVDADGGLLLYNRQYRPWRRS